jgi:hypothetical protein
VEKLFQEAKNLSPINSIMKTEEWIEGMVKTVLQLLEKMIGQLNSERRNSHHSNKKIEKAQHQP